MDHLPLRTCVNSASRRDPEDHEENKIILDYHKYYKIRNIKIKLSLSKFIGDSLRSFYMHHLEDLKIPQTSIQHAQETT